MFEDMGDDNYQLQAGSPAIDAGDTGYDDAVIPHGVFRYGGLRRWAYAHQGATHIKESGEMKTKKAFFSSVLVILTILVINGNAWAATIYVPDDEPNIQDAIDAAANGDTIIVRDGTYSEYIELGTLVANTKNNLTIQAENKGSATIQYTENSPTSVIYIEGDSGGVPTVTTIDGFNLVRSNRGKGAGVLVSNSNTSTYATVTVKNCNMSGNKMRSGVRLNGYIEATITGNTITGPSEAGIATSAPDTSSNEDYLYGNSIVTIEDNIINGNSVTNQAGIFLKGYAGNTVQVVIRGTATGEPKSSRIYGNATAGIRLEDIYGTVTIDNNEVNNNSKAGICIIDVGSGPPTATTATVQNNNVHDNTQAGITVAGASYLTIGSNNNINDNGTAGVAFRKASITVLYSDPINVSSQPVTISGNNIYSNSYAGIGIIDAITGTVTITDQNDIYQNTGGGIGIQHDCTVVITKNTIRNNVRGGIHTGTQVADPGEFSGTAGSADLTIKQNKVYGNGNSGYGAGIDVRHADGSINNNLVYKNHRGGIRFGDWIDEIINNTVVDNGNATDDMGGGIVYDDISAGDGVNDAPAGTPPVALLIRNNICFYNQKAGIRACFTNTPGSEERDYNLVYLNNGTTDDCGWYTDTGISYIRTLSCANKQYGGCGADWPVPFAMEDPHDIIADPLFKNITIDDYRLQRLGEGDPNDSPAIDAGDPASAYNDTDASRNDMGAYGGPTPIDW